MIGAMGIVAEMSNGGGGNGEEGNGEGSEGGENSTGNGEGGDNVNGSSEAPTEGIILIVFVYSIDDVFLETNNEEENTNGDKGSL